MSLGSKNASGSAKPVQPAGSEATGPVPQPRQGPWRLLVEVHHMTNPQADHAVAKLLEKLNATQCVYPGTNLTLHFTLVSSQMPRDQGV